MENKKDTSLSMQLVEQFDEIVTLIKSSRNNIIHITNTALIDLYWNVGEYLYYKLSTSEWGSGVVNQLSEYITKKYPEIKGFSNKNLWRMKQFYENYSLHDTKLSPLVREINWTNNMIILSRTKSIEEKEFYLRLCISERYSKRELERQISSALFERTMLSSPKTSTTLKEIVPDSDKVFKDKYVMEFIGSKDFPSENNMKSALVKQMKDFILELGKDFIFIDQEYRLEVGHSDFRIDLLFYHRELQCLVAFELKTDKFKPEYLGQLDFYLEALDRDVKKANENPSIGILLCKDKDDEVVEYALNRSLSPTMVAEYQLYLPDKKILQLKLREIFDEII